LHIERPFFQPLCHEPFASLSCGGGCSFPSPMPAERWRNPPAKPQARANQESESKPESGPGADPRARVQGRARFALDPRARVQGRDRFALDSRARVQGEIPILFYPGSPGVRVRRKSPISVGLKSPMDSRVRCKTNRTLCASLA
jgi:hypothetical protein